jgi:hypothetical protein
MECKDKEAAIQQLEKSIKILSHNSDRLRQTTSGNFAHSVNTVICLQDDQVECLKVVLNWLKNESNKCTTKTDSIS